MKDVDLEAVRHVDHLSDPDRCHQWAEEEVEGADVEFQELNHVDLLSTAFISPRNSAILLSHRVLSVHLHSHLAPNWCFCDENMLPVEVIDNGLATLATGCPTCAASRSLAPARWGC
ncbi:hypothetical protein LR48_Vigan10g028800 [Vigna angularis]|uniref:Uncharacterized protein n=1 Tax=Phaseolus angularis TaxID=3914 RepID=A0A0L9VH71_PHAAN|nr:hypothetical protein LR48_Vigan10g028800 [Vigna angularis]